MKTQSSANQRQVILHAVLAGLTPFIPIPFVDDVVKTYFKRRLVRQLAASHGQSFHDTDLATLADDADTGCLTGCLTTMLIYPLKAVFRKIFFFLEWKRAIDIVSHTYYRGYLIDVAFAEGWVAPYGLRDAKQIRAAMDSVLAQLNTSLIDRSVRGIFRQSRSALRSAARLLQNGLRNLRGKPSEQDVAQVIEALEEQEEREVAGVINQLQNAINKIPAEHFEHLRTQLEAVVGSQ